MLATDFLESIAEALYVLVFALTGLRALRSHTHANWDIALFFGVSTLVVALALVQQIPGVQVVPLVATVSGALLMCLPYLLLRLAAGFSPVRPLVLRGAEAGLLVSLAVLFAISPTPFWAVVLLVAYFAATVLYSGTRFIREAGRTVGVTQRRMHAVALGSLFLALDIIAAGAGAGSSVVSGVAALLGAICGLASGLCYFVGFVPPAWLRQAWQDPAVRAFLHRSTGLSRQTDMAQVVRALEAGAASVVGAPAAAIGLWREDEQVLRFLPRYTGAIDRALQETGSTADDLGFHAAPGHFDVKPGHMIAGLSFAQQRPILSVDPAREAPELRAFYRATEVGAALAAPISAAESRLGVLVVYAPRAPIFGDSDLELIEVLADQAAVILESRALAEEVASVRAREEADRLKDEFLASVSHDLRNPLSAIRGIAQVLRRRLERSDEVDTERLIAGLSSIDTSTHQMAALIDQLLDYTRLQMDRPLDLDRRPVDLVALTRGIASAQESATDQHPIRLDAPDNDLTGLWDEARLERVLQNLLSNAVKYSPEGGEIHVRLWREQADGQDWAVCSVKDQGIGIPAEDLPHVFDRFHRASNVLGQIAGTGVGLATARQAVEQHGGTILVTSDEGRGSTFTVCLPLNNPVETENDAAVVLGAVSARAPARDVHPTGESPGGGPE